MIKKYLWNIFYYFSVLLYNLFAVCCCYNLRVVSCYFQNIVD